MKKKFLIALTAVFVLGLAMAVYAFNQPNNSGKTTASCCAKSDACPLKNKNAATAENQSADSCCDKADCCCKSGACPMKAKGEKGAADCCGDCCGGSCPMKNKETQMTMIQTSGESVAGSESCHHNSKAGI